MTAADVLRARADEHERWAEAFARRLSAVGSNDPDAKAAVSGNTAAELRALADLVEACVLSASRTDDWVRCIFCCNQWRKSWLPSEPGYYHAADCPLAAVERVIGEQGNE